MVEELLSQLDLNDRVTWVMKKRGLTYDSLIPAINKNMPSNVTTVKGRSEISRALSHGYSKGNRGTKNNAIIDAIKLVLEIN